MKKLLTTILLFISLTCFSQEKKDSVVQITLTVEQYKALIQAIDKNIDSKKVTQDIIEFIVKNAALKPKEVTIKK